MVQRKRMLFRQEQNLQREQRDNFYHSILDFFQTFYIWVNLIDKKESSVAKSWKLELLFWTECVAQLGASEAFSKNQLYCQTFLQKEISHGPENSVQVEVFQSMFEGDVCKENYKSQVLRTRENWPVVQLYHGQEQSVQDEADEYKKKPI